MKRTVKAWAIIDTDLKKRIWGVRLDEQSALVEIQGYRFMTVVPCTITYDDGKKKK